MEGSQILGAGSQDEQATERENDSSSREDREKGDEKERAPWFLQVDPPRHPPSQHQAKLPTAPEGGPTMLGPMIKYIYEDMGLDDISLLDLRDLDPPAALGPNLIMLFGTARSERHLHIAAGRFARWLKRGFRVSAKADGLIGAGELRTKLRRLRKRAKLMGTNTAVVPGGDNGISTGWVCVSFHVDGQGAEEAASFDDQGHISGFGKAQTGTTVVVQCLTESRRLDLDLESLWQGVLRRSLGEEIRITRGKPVKQEDLEHLVSSRVQLAESSSATQWQAMKNASQQHRYFSTSSRRTATARIQRTKPPADQIESGVYPGPHDVAEGGPQAKTDHLNALSQVFRQAQLSSTYFTWGDLEEAITAVLQIPVHEGRSSDRLDSIREILLTAYERGMQLESTNTLVSLIEAIVTSPAYGPELRTAQENFEYLLNELGRPLEASEVSRLMTAYASRSLWDQFWAAFRNPPRFCLPRQADHYELAYGTMASTQDRNHCRDALRWVFPEMMLERDGITMSDSLLSQLTDCILVAEPDAVEFARSFIPPYSPSLALRRAKAKEFGTMLYEAIELRREAMRAEQPQNPR